MKHWTGRARNKDSSDLQDLNKKVVTQGCNFHDVVRKLGIPIGYNFSVVGYNFIVVGYNFIVIGSVQVVLVHLVAYQNSDQGHDGLAQLQCGLHTHNLTGLKEHIGHEGVDKHQAEQQLRCGTGTPLCQESIGQLYRGEGILENKKRIFLIGLG